MKTYLFLGGPADGERRPVKDDQAVVQVLPLKQGGFTQDAPDCQYEKATAPCLYHRRLFHESDDRTLTAIYVAEGFEQKVMARLIEHYQPENPYVSLLDRVLGIFNEILSGPAADVAEELHYKDSYPDPQILRAALVNALRRIDHLELAIQKLERRSFPSTGLP